MGACFGTTGEVRLQPRRPPMPVRFPSSGKWLLKILARESGSCSACIGGITTIAEVLENGAT